MNERPLVTSPRSEHSPSATLGALRIAVQWSAQRGEMRRWSLHGHYLLRDADAPALAAPPLQRALCLTVSAGLRHESTNLLGSQLAFPDDEARENGTVRGYFNVDMLSRFPLAAYERCFVLVSLGPYLSNVVEIVPGDGDGAAGY